MSTHTKLLSALFLATNLLGCQGIHTSSPTRPDPADTTAADAVAEIAQPQINQPPQEPEPQPQVPPPDTTQSSSPPPPPAPPPPLPRVEPVIEMQIGTELAQSSVSILNQSSSALAFYLGGNGQQMTRYVINGGIFWYSPNFTNDPVIVIYSPSGRVHYRLDRGSSYKIFWDQQGRRWDVREFDKR